MNRDIRRHIVETYINLRIGMSILAFALPMVLIAGSVFDPRYAVQDSLSSYYHTPMRNIFVGGIITIGVCLHLYKGFIKCENLLLNYAGAFAVAVALFPAHVPDTILLASPGWLPNEPFVAPMLHGAFAIAFFIIISYVCISCSTATIALIQNLKRRRRYYMLYRIFGVLMIVLPVCAAGLSFFTVPDYAVLVAETCALWVFSVFWLFKSREVNHQASVLELQLRDEAARASAKAKAVQQS